MQDLKPAIQLLKAASRRVRRAEKLVKNSKKTKYAWIVEKTANDIDEVVMLFQDKED